MSGIEAFSPKGMLHESWSAQANDYAIVCGWALQGKVFLVGDGMNDAEARGAVELFVGYGGHGYREKIAALASVYLSHPSMAALLPIVLSSSEVNQLSEDDKQLYEKGLAVLNNDNLSLT